MNTHKRVSVERNDKIEITFCFQINDNDSELKSQTITTSRLLGSGGAVRASVLSGMRRSESKFYNCLGDINGGGWR